MSTLSQVGRSAGVLLHPTSLPSGKIDKDAYRFVDWLAKAGVHVWQMLPLGVPLMGRSPYQCASAFAVDPALFDANWVEPDAPLFPGDVGKNDAFTIWYRSQKHWVEDYALFMVLKQQFPNTEWSQWPAAYRQREANALFELRNSHAAEISHIIDQQYQCYRQWQALRAYAAAKNVLLFGDMPIFVAYDSADVWAHPKRFLLDENGHPTVVTGVPPDYFSETGQRWGNPHYNWEQMQGENFLWWRERLAYHFVFFDLVRIDHFRGLAASWVIAADEPTAVNGYWQTVPGDAMLASVKATMGSLPLVAEDLGMITPDVVELRDKYALPGMSVLQFGFDYFDDNPHKPQNVRDNTVYYTGTHDNDTTIGWFNSLDEAGKQRVMQVLGIHDPAQVMDAMLETIFASRAFLAIVPLQDLLRLDSSARMNTPGIADGNWAWQFDWAAIPESLASELHNKLQGHQRDERTFTSVTTRDAS